MADLDWLRDPPFLLNLALFALFALCVGVAVAFTAFLAGWWGLL